jgi:hypothetical protein
MGEGGDAAANKHVRRLNLATSWAQFFKNLQRNIKIKIGRQKIKMEMAFASCLFFCSASVCVRVCVVCMRMCEAVVMHEDARRWSFCFKINAAFLSHRLTPKIF